MLATSYQAFMKMLRNWTPRLVLEVSTVFRQRMSQTWATGSPSLVSSPSAWTGTGSNSRGPSPMKNGFPPSRPEVAAE